MKTQSEFKVGETYSHSGSSTHHWVCVGYSSKDKRAILERDDGLILIHARDPDEWREVFIPRVIYVEYLSDGSFWAAHPHRDYLKASPGRTIKKFVEVEEK